MKSNNLVFIDADAFIALNFYNHPTYKKALKLAELIEVKNLNVVTCTYVLLEVATVLNKRFKGRRGPQVVTDIINNPKIGLIKGDDFLEKGIKMLVKQKSKNVSLNDCVYFAISTELNINKVFSFDKHWVKNGFNLLE